MISQIWMKGAAVLQVVGFINEECQIPPFGVKGESHVDAAARMIGLKRVTKQTEDSSNLSSEPVTPQSDLPKPTEATPTSTPALTDQPESSTVKEPVYESDKPEPLPTTQLTVPLNPYPEDEAPVEREAASLRLPPRRFRTSAPARGPIVGVEKAATLQDLVLVRTLLEAAKFQPIRQLKEQQVALDRATSDAIAPTPVIAIGQFRYRVYNLESSTPYPAGICFCTSRRQAR